MANVIKEQILVDTNRTSVVKYVGILDNTSMANNLLLDVSNLAFSLNTNGYVMTGGVDHKTTYRTTIKRCRQFLASPNLAKSRHTIRL